MNSAIERREVHFSGRVQGVGFRYRTSALADRWDVSGYVRNLPDGRVQLVVEGDVAQLDRFISDVRQAMADYITDCSVEKSVATRQFSRFSIRH